MHDFFLEGGWGMWTILVFGLVAVGAAGRFAYSPERHMLWLVISMSITLIITTAHATWSDLATVSHFLSDITREGKPSQEVQSIFFQGFKESTRPGLFAGLFLTLTWLLVSIGFLRGARVRA